MYPGKTSQRSNSMLSISSDYSVFDNKETIYWTNIGSSQAIISNAIRKPSTLSFSDENGTIVYVASIEFLIWKTQVSYAGTFIPKVNAEIIDNLGKKYKVNSIDDGVLRSRWSVQSISVAAQGTN